MASDWFYKTLGTVAAKAGEATDSLLIEESIIGKGLSMRGMFQARAETGEGIPPKLAEDAEEAVLKQLDDILDDMADMDLFMLSDGDTWYSKYKKGSVKTSGSFLQDKRGKFISALKLKQLLNLTLYKHARDLMGIDGQLVHRTGRLAHSGVITDIATNGETRTVSYQFLYMLYPYQVFDNTSNPKLNNNGLRSPEKLFKEATLSALQSILNKRSFETVTHLISQRVK